MKTILILNEIQQEHISDRFWDKVDVRGKDECWEYLGAHNQFGYGIFYYEKQLTVAHRVSYELVKGRIPEGLDLDHLCRNRGCSNPDHLEPVTRKENMNRNTNVGWNGGNWERVKTHCLRGHPFSGTNLYVNPKGERKCRMCRKILEW